MGVIHHARKLNKDSKIFVQSPKALSSEEFSLLLDEANGSTPVMSFIVGTILWWNLAQPSWKEEKRLQVGLTMTPLSDRGRTVAKALEYLQEAVNAGHESGYVELYKCHAFLAREFLVHAKWD